MDETLVIQSFNESIRLILLLSAPLLLGSLIVGLIISIFQATTQIQEQTLTYVPKIMLIFLMLIFIGPWMLMQLNEYTLFIFNLIEKVAQ
jgi:flagellar biosynthetic protein FliQ